MAVSSARVTVTTDPTVIASVPASGSSSADYKTRRFVVANRSATPVSIFLGDSTVTTGTGLEWTVDDDIFEVALEPGETLYGRVAAGSQTLHVLSAGR